MIHPTPLYIVASPRQNVGKTLIARLLIDFLLTSERLLEGYDLNPHDPTLAKRFPGIVIPIDIGETSGKMQLFDRLLAHDLTTKVIDLGCGQFAQFFAVMREIDFVTEARQRLIEPVVLFVADRRRRPFAPMTNCAVNSRRLRFCPCTTRRYQSPSQRRTFRLRGPNTV